MKLLLSFSIALAAAGATLSPEQLQSDFDLMQKALDEAHSGFYRYTPKPELTSFFAKKRVRLNKPMTTIEFRAALAETLALIKCGHTGIAPDDEILAAMKTSLLFPLRVAIEGSRLVVLRNETAEDQSIKPGMELVEINGRKVSSILRGLLRHQPGDGDIETGKIIGLQRSLGRDYWMFADQAETFKIRARDPNTRKDITSQLNGVRNSDREKNAKANTVNADAIAAMAKIEWTRERFDLRFLDDPTIAQIRIGGFGGSEYPAWIEKTFKTLQDRGTKSLIIDLRGNGGGNDMYGAMLVSYLTDKPFRYFDHIDMNTIAPSMAKNTDWRPQMTERLKAAEKQPDGRYRIPVSIHQGVAEQQPGKYPFMGKVFVLIDGGSFSTTADFCAIVRHLGRATFIGQETGGAAEGNNSGAQMILTLPNSLLKVRIPMWQYWNANPGAQRRRGTKPDHVVETRATDLLRGHDPVLEKALALAR